MLLSVRSFFFLNPLLQLITLIRKTCDFETYSSITFSSNTENLQAIEKGQAGLPTRKDDENYHTPPSSPIKDATAAIARHYDELEHIKEEPLESYDLELMNELAAHVSNYYIVLL